MTSRDFCYWLQGFFELSGGKALSKEQAQLVRKHLSMVFEHEIDPLFGKSLERLRELHGEASSAGSSAAGLDAPITC